MARSLQHIVLAVLFTSILAWRLKSTHENVIVNVTDDVTLRCDTDREDTTESDSTSGQITKIRLLKLGSSSSGRSSWKRVAEINVRYYSSRATVLDDMDLSDVIASGHLGATSQAFLSVTWPTATDKTPGSYKCVVDGYVREEENDFHHRTTAVNIASFVPSVTDLVAIIIQMKANLRTVHETLQRDMEAKNENQTRAIMKNVERMIELNQLEARIWPTGNYALPATSDGCPDSTPGNQFSNGNIKIRAETNAEPRHALSASSHLSEPFFERRDSSNSLNFQYCTHTTSPNQVETLHVPWPKGSYCIRENLNTGCPANFQTGSLHFYPYSVTPMVITSHNNPHYHHDPPTRHMLFDFCCRNDGEPFHAVILPTARPFYLYRYGGICQSVLNMEVTEEWILIDTDEQERDFFGRGSHPDSSLNDVKLKLCYYSKTVP